MKSQLAGETEYLVIRPHVAKNPADHGCCSDTSSLTIESFGLCATLGLASDCLTPETQHDVCTGWVGLALVV
jgi:hypothetical protein